MSGYALGQGYGYGLTEQSTIVPGQANAAPAPAAGANYVYTLSRFDRARLIAVTFDLTTSSTDVARAVTIAYSGNSPVSAFSDPTAATVPKSVTAQGFRGALNYGTYAAPTGLPQSFPLCGIWIEAGSTVSILVAAIDTTDQLANIRLTFDRWPGGGYVPAQSDQ